MIKGKIVMIDGKKIDHDESVQVHMTHKDKTDTRVCHEGHIKSLKFKGGLKVMANQ